MLLEGGNVNQAVSSTEMAGRGLTYSLPLFSVGVFSRRGLCTAAKREDGISLGFNVLLPSRGAFVASNSLLPAWLLMPSRRQCHTHVDGAPSRLPGRSDRGLSRLFFRGQS